MPLMNYLQVRPWAAAIREAVVGRTMPPWDALPNAGHAFRNDRSLTADEIATVKAWVDAGAPEGAKVGTVAVEVKKDRGQWHLGKPDVTVRVPGFEVPKSGALPYSFLIVPLRFEKDTWVRAVEFHVDQRAVIHHINAFVRPPGSSFLAGFPTDKIFVPTVADRGKRRDAEPLFDRRELLSGYEPGYVPAPWLEDSAKLIRAGSDVVFEMHYNPNGKAVTDYTELALYFAEAEPRYRLMAIDTLRDLDLSIPAGAGDYVSNAAVTLGREAYVLSVQPHMHTRGKSMIVDAVLPNGTKEALVDVPKYDFRWQTTYTYMKPVLLPAGTTLTSKAVFDNSSNNAFNPDPAKTVHWGDQTTDEMHIAFLELVIPAKADPGNLLKERPKMIGGGK